MTDEWRVDDLALCISRHPSYPVMVQPGAIFTVRTVIRDMPDMLGGQAGIAQLSQHTGTRSPRCLLRQALP